MGENPELVIGWACCVSFPCARMLKATLVSAGAAARVAVWLWLRFCGDALRCACISVGLRRGGGWRAVPAFLRGCAVMRLHFLGVASWRGLCGCGCVSAGLRCDTPAFPWGRVVAWAVGLWLRFCGVWHSPPVLPNSPRILPSKGGGNTDQNLTPN